MNTTYYLMNADGGITASEDGLEAKRNAELQKEYWLFTTEAELLATGVSMPTLVEAWNGIPGLKPVNKFKDRKTGAARIFAAIVERLSVSPRTKPAETTPEAESKSPATGPREGTKKAQALAILRNGTTREALQTALGWQPHTTRGFLSILGRTHTIQVASGDGGVRTYRLA